MCGGGGGDINRQENITREVETTRRFHKYQLSKVERPQMNYINRSLFLERGENNSHMVKYG